MIASDGYELFSSAFRAARTAAIGSFLPLLQPGQGPILSLGAGPASGIDAGTLLEEAHQAGLDLRRLDETHWLLIAP